MGALGYNGTVNLRHVDITRGVAAVQGEESSPAPCISTVTLESLIEGEGVNPVNAGMAVRAAARELGFDLVGIASAQPSRYREYLRQWLDDGRAGTMDWLGREFEKRGDPSAYLPGCKSVVCVALNYNVPIEKLSAEESRWHGRVARYAMGDDYHGIMTARLDKLADWICERFPGARTRRGVDTAPIGERELAARAGIGWVGKHTLVINSKIGSWLFLGEVLTTLELAPDEPAVDHCGTCRRCIEACPTGAIVGEYQLDARKCISYLNIEHRGEIEPELAGKMGDWLVGCDICQEVCPHNREAPYANDLSLRPRQKTGTLDLREVLSWRSGEANPTLSGTAIKRVKLAVLQGNARAILRRREERGM
jgi:epoxyqueuosine reductase